MEKAFLLLEVRLDQREPLGKCCSCCSLRTGVHAALYTFLLEAAYHVSISLARPLWEWTSTALTIFAFVLQDLCRVILVILAIAALRALRPKAIAAHPEWPVVALRRLFRGLIVLILLEFIELCLNASAVHAVCDAPEVWERREAAALSNRTTMSESCLLYTSPSPRDS